MEKHKMKKCWGSENISYKLSQGTQWSKISANAEVVENKLEAQELKRLELFWRAMSQKGNEGEISGMLSSGQGQVAAGCYKH